MSLVTHDMDKKSINNNKRVKHWRGGESLIKNFVFWATIDGEGAETKVTECDLLGFYTLLSFLYSPFFFLLLSHFRLNMVLNLDKFVCC